MHLNLMLNTHLHIIVRTHNNYWQWVFDTQFARGYSNVEFDVMYSSDNCLRGFRGGLILSLPLMLLTISTNLLNSSFRKKTKMAQLPAKKKLWKSLEFLTFIFIFIFQKFEQHDKWIEIKIERSPSIKTSLKFKICSVFNHWSRNSLTRKKIHHGQHGGAVAE